MNKWLFLVIVLYFPTKFSKATILNFLSLSYTFSSLLTVNEWTQQIHLPNRNNHKITISFLSEKLTNYLHLTYYTHTLNPLPYYNDRSALSKANHVTLALDPACQPLCLISHWSISKYPQDVLKLSEVLFTGPGHHPLTRLQVQSPKVLPVSYKEHREAITPEQIPCILAIEHVCDLHLVFCM